MDLIAGCKCFYRGRTIPEGQRFTAPRQYARALLTMKRARIAPQTAPATYSHRAITQTRRVDMQAERPVPAAFARFDHDSDGEPGGSKAPPRSEELTALRAQYTAALGKRPFPGWSADVLRAKIAAHEDDEG